MDTLRSIPQSLAALSVAARSGLRHALRELMNAKVHDSYAGRDAASMTASASATSAMPSPSGSGGVPSAPNDKLPSPWGFITSGYALGLLLMVRFLHISALSLSHACNAGSSAQPDRTCCCSSAPNWPCPPSTTPAYLAYFAPHQRLGHPHPPRLARAVYCAPRNCLIPVDHLACAGRRRLGTSCHSKRQ